MTVSTLHMRKTKLSGGKGGNVRKHRERRGNVRQSRVFRES